MTSDEIILEIGRNVYGHDNIKSNMARGLGVSRTTIDNWLERQELDKQLKQQLIGFIDIYTCDMQERLKKLEVLADRLRASD